MWRIHQRRTAPAITASVARTVARTTADGGRASLQRMNAGLAGHTLPRLVEIMDRLLAPNGCPWDREQTLTSLRPFLVEETYEVLEAIDLDNAALHCEELGDLLMQIVFHAAIAARRDNAQRFDMDMVIAGISEKLVRRHPHVFADTTGIDNPEQVLAQWEQIKAKEKADAGAKPRALDGVPVGLPALARAQKISSRAGKVGFDWPTWHGSLDKVREEVGEVAEIADGSDDAAKHHEIGDLLFAVVNTARKLGVDAEQALRDATTRFQSRFSYVEDALAAQGKTPKQSNLEEMDALWNLAKQNATR